MGKEIDLAQNLDMFEHLCGKSALKNVALVTTKWRKRPTIEESKLELEREGGLIEKYWKDMTDQGSYVERHDGTATSGRRIITMLRDRPMMVPQGETVHAKRRFEEARAGKGTSRGDEQQGKETAPDPGGKSKASRGWKTLRCWTLGVILGLYLLMGFAVCLDRLPIPPLFFITGLVLALLFLKCLV